jgi:undecaprenyl pyrophosphate phosphatase UppP
MADLISEGTGVSGSILVGTVVAGVAGYFAIALLIRILTQVGLAPFGIYCVLFGAFSLIVL